MGDCGRERLGGTVIGMMFCVGWRTTCRGLAEDDKSSEVRDW